MHVLAQNDSIIPSHNYQCILGKVNLSIGEIRGFVLGDSLATILRTERAILEAQGNDFLYYRVLCDSTLSAEISYTFDEKGLLISIGIEFFELNKHKLVGSLSDEFLMNLMISYRTSSKDESDFLKWNGQNGLQIEYQKNKREMNVIHTQIEFY